MKTHCSILFICTFYCGMLQAQNSYSISDLMDTSGLKISLLVERVDSFSKALKWNQEFANTELKATNLNLNSVEFIGRSLYEIDSIFLNENKYSLTNGRRRYLDSEELKIYSVKTRMKYYIVFIGKYSPCNNLSCRLTRFNIFELKQGNIVQSNFDIVYGDIRNICDINQDGTLEFISCEIDQSLIGDENGEYYDYHKIELISLADLESTNLELDKYTLWVKYDRENSQKTGDFYFYIVKGEWFKHL